MKTQIVAPSHLMGHVRVGIFVYNQNVLPPAKPASRMGRSMYWRFHALSPFALIESGSNPADSASRGLKPTELKKTKEWLNGPEFLRDDEDTWQKNPDEIKRMADEHLEWRRNVQVNQVLAEKSNLTTNDFLEYYSNWYALQKGVSWLLRFISFLKQRRQKMKTIPGQLTVTEIRTATVRIVNNSRTN